MRFYLSGQHVSAVIRGITARKKGLNSSESYLFSVKPINVEHFEFSVSSAPFALQLLSPFMTSLLPRELLAKKTASSSSFQTVPTADALGGKVVAVYFSAHWCGPCRNFTPQLSALYAQV